MMSIIADLASVAMKAGDPVGALHSAVQDLIAQGHEPVVVALELHGRALNANPPESQVIKQVLRAIAGSTDEIEDRLRRDLATAMTAPSPYERFREGVVNLLNETGNRAAIALAMENIRASSAGDEEDVVADVLDLMTGWCAPANKI